MIGKIIAIIVVVLVVVLGVFVYEIAVHPASVGISSSWLHGVASSSAFDFALNSSHTAPLPAGIPPAPRTQQQQQSTTVIEPPAATGTAAIDPTQIPAGYTVSQLSPYFHQVRFAGVSPGTRYYYGEILLDTELNPGENVDVTGWQIETGESGEYIPQAINLYDPSGLTPPTDIILHQNDTLALYSTSAPFNLRLNECVGYIAHVADFSPALPQDCPSVDRSSIQNLTGVCQEYIQSIGSCQTPNLSNSYVPATDYSCYNYLENNFNYRSCFNAHVGDVGFLSNQVWVWTGSNVVSPYHDTVKLLDKNGLLVDLYSY